MFTGVYTALVTPFREGGLDPDALASLVEWQIESGIDGLVPCGTTGEAATLTFDERTQVIETVVRAADGRVPVIAGAGSNSTAATIELSKAAMDAGADGLLLVCPYYNKPSQGGLEAHFRAVLDQVEAPTLLYNIPGRTGVDLQVETVARLAEHPMIVGIKEASGSVVRAAQLVKRLSGSAAVLSGEDPLYLPILAVGGEGIVSASACVAPAEMAAVWRSWTAGAVEEARSTYLKLLALFEALFVESNPVPAKAALKMMGRTTAEVRAPLVGPSEATLEKVGATLREVGVMS